MLSWHFQPQSEGCSVSLRCGENGPGRASGQPGSFSRGGWPNQFSPQISEWPAGFCFFLQRITIAKRLRGGVRKNPVSSFSKPRAGLSLDRPFCFRGRYVSLNSLRSSCPRSTKRPRSAGGNFAISSRAASLAYAALPARFLVGGLVLGSRSRPSWKKPLASLRRVTSPPTRKSC